MDVMGDFSDLDTRSNSLVQAVENDLPLTRIEKIEVSDISFTSPISLVKTPVSAAERSSRIWPNTTEFSLKK